MKIKTKKIKNDRKRKHTERLLNEMTLHKNEN